MNRHAVLFVVYACGLCAVFGATLRDLLGHALGGSLYSHMLLIVPIVMYLLYAGRATACREYGFSPVLGATFFAVGAAALAVHCLAEARGLALAVNDSIALRMFAFVSFLVGGAFLLLGSRTVCSVLFPVMFLYLLVPMPVIVAQALTTLMLQATVPALAAVLWITRTPFIRDGFGFELPGLTISIAPQCSGIRSSFVLLIVSLLCGHMFLSTFRRRALLTVSVFLIGPIRNALRIAIVSLAAIHIDPGLMQSPLHKRGGPFFFALSLVPLFGLMLVLRRGEQGLPASTEGGAS